jgi:hypothetical protein
MSPNEKSDNGGFRVVDASLVGGVHCRLIQLPDGSGKVESYVNGAWRPGGCTLKELLMGMPVPNAEGA